MSTLFSYFTKIGSKKRPSGSEDESDIMAPRRKVGKKVLQLTVLCSTAFIIDLQKRRCVIESDESDEDGNLDVSKGLSRSGVVANDDGGGGSNEGAEGDGEGGSTTNGGASGERGKTPKRRCMATPKRAALSSKVDTPTSASVTPSRKNSANNETFLHDHLKWLQRDQCR